MFASSKRKINQKVSDSFSHTTLLDDGKWNEWKFKEIHSDKITFKNKNCKKKNFQRFDYIKYI